MWLPHRNPTPQVRTKGTQCLSRVLFVFALTWLFATLWDDSGKVHFSRRLLYVALEPDRVFVGVAVSEARICFVCLIGCAGIRSVCLLGPQHYSE
ncbi:hypothetical protein BJV78DRAFT_124705 [Lactifluus subvellereus]|nr:hypothetical protein BJV78DRAFT_124705 [Lactifluus subvellereus]